MKRNLFSMMMCLSVLCMGFTACGDKDNEKENDNYGKAIAGTYSGNLQMAGATIVPSASITIARDDDRHVTLKMNETVTVPPMELPVNIECKSDVAYSDNQYRVTGNTTFNMSMGDLTVPVPVAVDGTIDGNGKTSIRINVTVPSTEAMMVNRSGKMSVMMDAGVPTTGAMEIIFDGQRQ